MAMSATFTKAMIENNLVTLPMDEAKELLVAHKESDHFVASTFKDLYYTDEENDLIDTLRTNVAAIRDQYKHAIAMTALIRACTKKRPRGIFTYTGPVSYTHLAGALKTYLQKRSNRFLRVG